MIVDQSPEGLEVLRGASTYTFDGNWKLQAENGADGYHVSAGALELRRHHRAPQRRRQGRQRQGDGRRRLGQAGRRLVLASSTATCCCGPTGPTPRTGPSVRRARPEWVEKFGEAKADWMLRQSRNLCLYPNVYLMDQFSSQIRVVRPICGRQDRGHDLLHRAQGRERPRRARARIRQYEDFFNATGMATPDDLEEFRSCQQGYAGARGAVERPEPRRDALDRRARTTTPTMIGLKPELSGRQDRGRGPLHRAARLLAETMQASQAEEARLIAGRAPKARTAGGEVMRSHYDSSHCRPSCTGGPRAGRPRAGPTGWRCYADDVDFWMPSWDDDDKLTTDPQNEISLIYYPSKQGLEDRVFRIKTDRSSASTPEPRTSHTISTSRSWRRTSEQWTLRFNWHDPQLPLRDRSTRYFGTAHYTLDTSGGQAADQEQVRGAEERLHPPRARRLPRLRTCGAATRMNNMPRIALHFEDGVTRFIAVRRRTRLVRRRRLPRQASTSRWTAATAPAAPASALRERQLRRWATTSRTR